MIFGIGRVCHIAFWEPHFAEEFASAGRMEGPDASTRCAAASAHDRAERAHQLQEPHDPGSRLRQHDRARALPPGRSDHRRRRGRLRSRHAMAGRQPLDDASLRSRPVGAQLVHADSSRPALLPPRPGRPARAGDELNNRRARSNCYFPASAGASLRLRFAGSPLLAIAFRTSPVALPVASARCP